MGLLRPHPTPGTPPWGHPPPRPPLGSTPHPRGFPPPTSGSPLGPALGTSPTPEPPLGTPSHLWNPPGTPLLRTSTPPRTLPRGPSFPPAQLGLFTVTINLMCDTGGHWVGVTRDYLGSLLGTLGGRSRGGGHTSGFPPWGHWGAQWEDTGNPLEVRHGGRDTHTCLGDTVGTLQGVCGTGDVGEGPEVPRRMTPGEGGHLGTPGGVCVSVGTLKRELGTFRGGQ